MADGSRWAQQARVWRARQRQAAIACVVAVFFHAVTLGTVEGASFSLNGVTFSDHLGGFVLEKVTGEGSMDDPFVLIERMTDSNGGTLSFRVRRDFGNRIGSHHAIAFAVIKIVENTSDLAWNSFELELQSKLGVPSDYYDGLSFGQGSQVGRPFTAEGFDQVKVMDEPYDRVLFDHGRIPIGGHATLRFVISETMPLNEAYLLQQPGKPVAEERITSDRSLARK